MKKEDKESASIYSGIQLASLWLFWEGLYIPAISLLVGGTVYRGGWLISLFGLAWGYIDCQNDCSEKTSEVRLVNRWRWTSGVGALLDDGLEESWARKGAGHKMAQCLKRRPIKTQKMQNKYNFLGGFLLKLFCLYVTSDSLISDSISATHLDGTMKPVCPLI